MSFGPNPLGAWWPICCFIAGIMVGETRIEGSVNGCTQGKRKIQRKKGRSLKKNFIEQNKINKFSKLFSLFNCSHGILSISSLIKIPKLLSYSSLVAYCIIIALTLFSTHVSVDFTDHSSCFKSLCHVLSHPSGCIYMISWESWWEYSSPFSSFWFVIVSSPSLRPPLVLLGRISFAFFSLSFLLNKHPCFTTVSFSESLTLY